MSVLSIDADLTLSMVRTFGLYAGFTPNSRSFVPSVLLPLACVDAREFKPPGIVELCIGLWLGIEGDDGWGSRAIKLLALCSEELLDDECTLSGGYCS